MCHQGNKEGESTNERWFKFDGKSDEGFLVGYSVNSKAFRVYNLVTKRVEVNLHVNFLEEKPNVQGIGHRWMFDLDYLTDSMNYIPVSVQNQANPAGSKEVIDIDVQTEEVAELMVVSSTTLTGATRQAAVSEKVANKKTHSPKQPSSTPISKSADDIMAFRKELDALALKHLGPVHITAPTSTNPINTGSGNLNTGFEQVTPGNMEAISPSANHVEEVFSDADDDEMPEIRIYDKSSEGIFDQASYDDDGIIADFNNLPDEVDVPTNPTLRIHNAHPQSQILGDPNTPVQTRSSLKKITEAHALVSYIQAQQRSNHKDQQHCLFACFLSQFKPRKSLRSPEDELGEAMQEEPVAVSSFNKNKKDERGVVVRNKVRLVAQGHRQEEGIDYDELSYEYKAPLAQDKGGPDGKPKLGLWYPRESPLDLVAYSDSDYAAANLDRKSTTGGCQFLGRRLISWQCKKQTIVATSTTEAEYVAAASCCGQVLWLQNQLLDYGFNFMNTIIHIDNQSTICIIKNPVYHSKTKHIEIRHHFIRDCYEKKLIQVQKIHTDLNVADLLTKPFDGPRINLDMKKEMPAVTCQLDANWLDSRFPQMFKIEVCSHSQSTYLRFPCQAVLADYNCQNTCRWGSTASEESEQLRNLLDLVSRLESRVESLEKELSKTKQTLGTTVLKLIKKIKKLENKLRQQRKREETEYEEDAAGQDQYYMKRMQQVKIKIFLLQHIKEIHLLLLKRA
ncbi:hypothetical protein Tco_1171749, partial [Tanacetum coccineum]